VATLRAVPMSDYVRGLREKIGNDFLLVPSVAVAIRDANGRLLLVRHVEGRWQLPGGAVDPGEHPREAAARECREEAAIDIRVGDVLGVFGGERYRVTYANGDELGFVPILFAAEIVAGEPEPDGEETQAVGWFHDAETDALAMHPATREMIRASSRPARA
jgi:8-oxo-dGTP pyrophosphatase MutT (NUDIX family)